VRRWRDSPPSVGKTESTKFQAPNNKQITMTKIPNSKPFFNLERRAPELFRSLDIGIYLGFGAWDLEFAKLVLY
jgi:hypothetical protein